MELHIINHLIKHTNHNYQFLMIIVSGLIFNVNKRLNKNSTNYKSTCAPHTLFVGLCFAINHLCPHPTFPQANANTHFHLFNIFLILELLYLNLIILYLIKKLILYCCSQHPQLESKIFSI